MVFFSDNVVPTDRDPFGKPTQHASSGLRGVTT